jgi:hypothetical protein
MIVIYAAHCVRAGQRVPDVLAEANPDSDDYVYYTLSEAVALLPYLTDTAYDRTVARTIRENLYD